MRRAEFECNDFSLIVSHLDEIPFGTACIPDTPLPYAIPLSFCYIQTIGQQGAIGIHGASTGRKFALLNNSPKVSFTVAKPYSYIGSEFLGGTMIPTQFFFSALIVGQFRVVEDLAQKRAILSALVAKYEPQSSNFDFSKSAFSGKEKGVFVGLIEIESLSVKAKFGQNLKASEFESIMQDLQTRAQARSAKQESDIDSQTITLMKHLCTNAALCQNGIELSQDNLTIREVAQREESLINTLLDLWENCVRETHLFLSHNEILAIKPDAKNAIESIPHLLVLKDCALEDSSAKPLAFMGIAGQNVEMLFVAHRGQGFGKKLLQYAIAHFKITQVAVNEQNPNAIGFYKHCGFEVYKRSERDEQGRAYPLLYMRLQSRQAQQKEAQ